MLIINFHHSFLGNRLSSSLYNSNSSNCICEFDSFGYYSSITQKDVCFAGPNDEYACVTSDDFNVYLFRIPEELRNRSTSSNDDPIKFINSADFVLKGHRSIVNKVEYNHRRSILASSGVEKVIKLWSPFRLNESDDDLKENLSTVLRERLINPFPMTRSMIIDGYSDDESNNQTNTSNEDTVVLNFFDNLIRHYFCDDDIDEFIDLHESRSIDKCKVIDPTFDHDLHYIKSLISDFKQNGDRSKTSAIKQLKREQNNNRKQNGLVNIRSISYLFNNKKIKQSKIVLKRAYQLIEDRLRLIRKCKKEEENRHDDEWLSNVQTMIDNEPELKQMLIDLNEMYKDKRVVECISSPLYYNMLKRLAKLFFRRPFLRNLHVSADASPTAANRESSGDENRTDQSHSDKSYSICTDSEFDSDDSTEYGLTLSDDSLSAGSILNDKSETDDEDRKINEKNLKRKKSNKSFKSKCLKQSGSNNLFNFSVPSPSTDSDDSFVDGIRKFKKSNKQDKLTKNYNTFAFDSDLDKSSSIDSSSSSRSEDEIQRDSMRASTSSAKKRPFKTTTDKSEESLTCEDRKKKCSKADNGFTNDLSNIDKDQKRLDECSNRDSSESSDKLNDSNGVNNLDTSDEQSESNLK